MRKVICAVLSIVLLVSMTACKPSVGPVYNEKQTVTAADGTEFTVVFLEENVPDTEITITVSTEGQRIAENGSFDAYLSDYDYQNDFVDHWYQIIEEHHSDAVDAYQFYWGILYTVDDGTSYEMVPKHDYETKGAVDATFHALLDQLE